MARYHLIACVNHPDESGWTKERYPEIAERYNQVMNALRNMEYNKAHSIMMEHFLTDSDSIENHPEWDGELEIDSDGDGLFLFKKINY